MAGLCRLGDAGWCMYAVSMRTRARVRGDLPRDGLGSPRDRRGAKCVGHGSTDRPMQGGRTARDGGRRGISNEYLRWKPSAMVDVGKMSAGGTTGRPAYIARETRDDARRDARRACDRVGR